MMKALVISSPTLCRVLLAGSIALLSACYCIKKTPVPALIVNADVEAHKELSALMAKIIGQTKIRLSTSMFHTSSIVTLAQRDMSGRVLTMPTRFQLMRRADTCELHKLGTEEVWILEKVQCRIDDSESMSLGEHEHEHQHEHGHEH